MGCNHNCSSCSSKNCGERKSESLIVETAKENKIKKIIGVVSGKGGVGKSTVTSLLAINLAEKGYNVGILDADVTGPSIPKAFGINQEVLGNGELMFPPVSNMGILSRSWPVGQQSVPQKYLSWPVVLCLEVSTWFLIMNYEF